MSKLKMFNAQQLAGLLCIQNGISVIDEDGSPNWWVFVKDAENMLAAVDLERYEIPNASDAAMEAGPRRPREADPMTGNLPPLKGIV